MKLNRSSLRRNQSRKETGINFERTNVQAVGRIVDYQIERHPSHEVTVLTAPPRLRPKNPFAILFFRTMTHYLITNQLGIVEIKVLLLLLNSTDSENIVLKLSQKDLADEIGVNQSTVSRAFAKLIKTNLILTNANGSFVINPQLITRSSLRKIKQTDGYERNAAIQKRLADSNPLFDNF